jgi:hypothetical protein
MENECVMNRKKIWLEVVLVYCKYYICLSRLVETLNVRMASL